MTNIINNWIKIVNRCPNCNQNSLILKKIKSVVNSLKLKCNKENCKKIVNLRDNTTFNACSHTPISILVYAKEEFIEEEKNSTKVIEILNERYKLSTLGQKSIYKFFNLIRQCIAQYYKEVYLYEKLAYDSKYKKYWD